jgi:hypothetical protein
MQMVPRRGARQGGEEEATSAELGTGMVRDCYGALHSQEALEKEKEELAKVKRFCQTILKTLAPPILQELEKVSALRADAEPFTPKRMTRRSTAALSNTKEKKASVAESTLLKALGLCSENLSASDEDMRRFKEFFNSPVRDAHVQVLAPIFCKEMPSSFERQDVGRVGSVEVLAH